MKRLLLFGKKIICLLLVLVFSTGLTVHALAESDYSGLIIKLDDTGDNVLLLQLRLRDLGYYPYKITGQFGSVTKNAVVEFQKGNGLSPDGVVGGKTAELLFENEAKRISGSGSSRQPTPSPSPTPKAGMYGRIIEWSEAKKILKRGSKFRIMDFYTGKTYYAIMVGGYNHVDFEPATKEDTATMKSTYGGKWSWTRRPVLVRLNSRWYAGSVNGMPHGYETIPNNDMYQQVCLHFKGSRTHGTASTCSQHQRCVNIAAGLIKP